MECGKINSRRIQFDNNKRMSLEEFLSDKVSKYLIPIGVRGSGVEIIRLLRKKYAKKLLKKLKAGQQDMTSYKQSVAEYEDGIELEVKAKNTLNLSNIIQAFTCNSSTPTVGYSPGVLLYNSAGQLITEAPLVSSIASGLQNGAQGVVSALDVSNNSYTTASQTLVNQVSGYNIAYATASLNVTKTSDLALFVEWIITYEITSNPANVTILNIVGSNTPCGLACSSISGSTAICDNCSNCAFSNYCNFASSPLVGLTSQYAGKNAITNLIFTNMISSNKCVLPAPSQTAFGGSNAMYLAVNVTDLYYPCQTAPSYVMINYGIVGISAYDVCGSNAQGYVYDASSGGPCLWIMSYTFTSASCQYLGYAFTFSQ